MFFVIPWWQLRRPYILSMSFGVFFGVSLINIHSLYLYKKKKVQHLLLEFPRERTLC